MELQSRLIARRDPKADETALVTLLITYFKKLGTKQCAAMDLKLFLPSLEDSDANNFFAETYKEIALDKNITPMDIDQIHRHVGWYQLCRYLGR